MGYLTEARGLNMDTILSHKIGFCPWNTALPPDVRHFGEHPDKEDKRDWQYNLWGRVIVPIHDEFGEVVSLATKKPAIEGKFPWWNMPFVKSHVLFLLDKARKPIFKYDKVYITEGYVDGLMLYQNGVQNVVVLMGTAFTLRKIALIARYTENVCFCFDIDDNQSGQKASDLSIAILNKFGFCNEISVIDHMPVGNDPASYVQQYGIKAFLDGERVLSKDEIRKIGYRVDNRAREAMYAK
jgi:DNA primase